LPYQAAEPTLIRPRCFFAQIFVQTLPFAPDGPSLPFSAFLQKALAFPRAIWYYI
jgi:hypothetical protein